MYFCALCFCFNPDAAAAEGRLAYGFALRHYQQTAIHAAEAAIAQGQRDMLLAMATGTGKTKTCIALIYRLLKAQRFRRALFLAGGGGEDLLVADGGRDSMLFLIESLDQNLGLDLIAAFGSSLI